MPPQKPRGQLLYPEIEGCGSSTSEFMAQSASHSFCGQRQGSYFELKQINDQIKQNGNTSDMIFRIPRLIQHISSIMTLEEGDLLLTGTPAGVGPIIAGDKVECALVDAASNEELERITFGVADRTTGYLYKPSY
jgi:Fumarylacetoacetate (FAA) hydrolase family